MKRQTNNLTGTIEKVPFLFAILASLIQCKPRDSNCHLTRKSAWKMRPVQRGTETRNGEEDLIKSFEPDVIKII